MSEARSTAAANRENEVTSEEISPASKRRGLSVDSWAVLLALAAAVLVKLHILNTVKW